LLNGKGNLAALAVPCAPVGDSGGPRRWVTMAAMKARRDVKVEHLRQLPLFAGLGDGDLRRLAPTIDEVAVPQGYVLVHDGHRPHEVFVIVSGTAEFVSDGVVHSFASAGDVVGDLGGEGELVAAATVTATSSMRFLVFDQEDFLSLLQEFPLLAQRVAARRGTGRRDGGPGDGARRAGARRNRSGTAQRQPAFPGLVV